MSAPLDVLAVLAGAIAAEEVPTANSGSPMIARDLRRVHAAVAELMDAYADLLSRCDCYPANYTAPDAFARYRATLARYKGGAA